MNQFLVAVAALLFIYILVKKPDYFAVLFFTISLADINFDVAGVSFRAVMGLLLMARTIIDPAGKEFASPFRTKVGLIYVFLLYTLVNTMAYGLDTLQYYKITGQVVVTAYCGYHYFMKRGDYSILKTSLILASLICLGDLVYTYAYVGTFPVQRIYHAILGIQQEVNDQGEFIEVINHNFYGQTCAMCLMFLLTEYMVQKRTKSWELVILPLMLLGVLMSTSRSSLLGIIGVFLFLAVRISRSGQSSVRIIKITVSVVLALVFAFVLFSVVQDTLQLKAEFLNRISYRLVEEPTAVLQKRLGLNYNAQSLEAMEWREEASADAFGAFMRLEPLEQFFGIGYWGFVVRNLGHTNLPPHNGFLLLLIENGIVGFAFYMFIVIGAIRTALRKFAEPTPFVCVLIFIFLYCIGQNGELTLGTTFLFISTMLAQNYLGVKEPKDDDPEPVTELKPV